MKPTATEIRALRRPKGREYDALCVLWEEDRPLTTRQVFELLCARCGAMLSYTSVRGAMKSARAKGFVTATRQGRALVYTHAMTRESALALPKTQAPRRRRSRIPRTASRPIEIRALLNVLGESQVDFAARLELPEGSGAVSVNRWVNGVYGPCAAAAGAIRRLIRRHKSAVEAELERMREEANGGLPHDQTGH